MKRKLILSALLLQMTPISLQAQEVTTIAALGDSLTQGYGLVQSDGFVPQLQLWIEAQGIENVVLINAGVSGDTTAGGLARTDWTLTPDVNGVIVILGGNDLLRGVDPSVSRLNLDKILYKITAKNLPVLLAGMPAPGNYGPNFKAQFDRIFPILANKYGAILHPNFMSGLGEGNDLRAVAHLLQGDGIHPNPEGVKRIVNAIGPRVLELIKQARTK